MKKRISRLHQGVVGLLLGLVVLAGPVWALNEWTILLHFTSDDKDHGLQEANLRQVQAMGRQGPPPGCEIVVLEDYSPAKSSALGGFWNWYGSSEKTETGGTIFTIEKGKVEIRKKLGEVNMGSPYVLWDFLKFAAQNHAAKRYLLLFNGHGSGIFSLEGHGGYLELSARRGRFRPGKIRGL
jgi:hypothetical protein